MKNFEIGQQITMPPRPAVLEIVAVDVKGEHIDTIESGTNYKRRIWARDFDALEEVKLELTEQDIADLAVMSDPGDIATAPRRIVRLISAYSHPDEPLAPGQEGTAETWVQGTMKHDEHEIALRVDSGAALGGTKLTLLLEVDGERVAWEYIDITTLVEAWAAAALDDYLSGNTAERDRIKGLLS